MIPLWLAIPCIIVCLIVIILWLMTIDIDWEEAFKNAKDIAMTMIIIVCPYDFGLAMLRPYIIDIGRPYIAHSVQAVSGKQSSGLFTPYLRARTASPLLIYYIISTVSRLLMHRMCIFVR